MPKHHGLRVDSGEGLETAQALRRRRGAGPSALAPPPALGGTGSTHPPAPALCPCGPALPRRLPALPAPLVSSSDSCWPACREETACIGVGPGLRLCCSSLPDCRASGRSRPGALPSRGLRFGARCSAQTGWWEPKGFKTCQVWAAAPRVPQKGS